MITPTSITTPVSHSTNPVVVPKQMPMITSRSPKTENMTDIFFDNLKRNMLHINYLLIDAIYLIQIYTTYNA